MIYTYGFVSNQRTIDNTYQNVAAVCEMSLDSMSYTKDMAFYSHANYPGINLFITRSVQGNGLNPPRKVMGAYAQELCIKIVKFIETQCFNGTLNSNYLTCRQAINAEFGAAIQSLEINKMVSFDSAKFYMPERISFIIPMTGSQQPEEERIYLWFSDRAFRTQYTYYTIDPVCMVDDIDTLLGDYDAVKAIVDTWTDNKYTAKMNEVKDKYPYTSANATIYKLYVKTGGIIDISLRACIWGSIGDNMDLIRDAWANYILDHSRHGRDVWEAAIPDLFVASEFIVVPYWQYYAVPNKELQKGIHSPSIPGKDLIPYITASVPFYSSTYVSEYYTQSSHMYSSLACSIIGNEKNRLADKRFEQEWPEYFLVPTTSVEFNRISPATRKMMGILHTLIKLADECNPDTELPIGVSKVLRSDIMFLSSTYLNVQYLVPLKWNYEKGVLSGSNSPTIPEYPSPEYDSEEAKRRREREEKAKEEERKKQEAILAEQQRIKREEEERLAAIEAARKERERQEKERIEREKAAHKQASIVRIKSELEVVKTYIDETRTLIGKGGDAFTDARSEYVTYRNSTSSRELTTASEFIKSTIDFQFNLQSGLPNLIKGNIDTINKLMELIYKDEYADQVKTDADALKPDIDHLSVDLATIEVNYNKLISMKNELENSAKDRKAIEQATEQSKKETIQKAQEALLLKADRVSEIYEAMKLKTKEIGNIRDDVVSMIPTLEGPIDSYYAETIKNTIKSKYDKTNLMLCTTQYENYIKAINLVDSFNHSSYFDQNVNALAKAGSKINMLFESIKNIFNDDLDSVRKISNYYLIATRVVYDRQDNEVDADDPNGAKKRKIIQLNKIIDDTYNKYMAKLQDRIYTTVYGKPGMSVVNDVTNSVTIAEANAYLNNAKNCQTQFLNELNNETEAAETIRAAFYEIANNVDINLVLDHYNSMKTTLDTNRTSTEYNMQINALKSTLATAIQNAQNVITAKQKILDEETAKAEEAKQLEDQALDALETKYSAELANLRAKLNNVRDQQLTEASRKLDTAERTVTDIATFNTASTIIDQLSAFYKIANEANSMLALSNNVIDSSGITTSFIRTSPVKDRLMTNTTSIETLTAGIRDTYTPLRAKYYDLNEKATVQYERYLTILRNEQIANATNDAEYNRLVEVQNKLAKHIIEARSGETIVKVLLEQITELNQIGVRVDAAHTTSELRVEKSIYETKVATIRINIIKLEDIINGHTSKYKEVSEADAEKSVIITYYDKLKTADTSFRSYLTNANQAITDSQVVYTKLIAKLNELTNVESNELALSEQINVLAQRGMNLISIVSANVTKFEVTTNNLCTRHDVTENISGYTVEKLNDMLTSLEMSNLDYQNEYQLIIEAQGINDTQIRSVIADAKDHKYDKYHEIYANAFNSFDKYPDTYTKAIASINAQKAHGDNNINAVRDRLNKTISSKNLNELNIRLGMNITDINVYLGMIEIRIPEIKTKFTTAQATLTTDKPRTLELLEAIDTITNATRLSLANTNDALSVAATNVINAEKAIAAATGNDANINELKTKFTTINTLKQSYQTKAAEFNQLVDQINQFKQGIA